MPTYSLTRPEIPLPFDLNRLISLGMDGIRVLEQLMLGSTNSKKRRATLRIDDVILKAPVPSPPKIVCLGPNCWDHAEEQDAIIPDEPAILMKPRTAIIGPDERIIRPGFVKRLDYEAELAIIISKRGKNISVSDAEKDTFGYTALNDVTARDIQYEDRQWTRGKSFDTFAPIGPYITTANQIENPHNLSIRTRVSGELRQNSSTKNMVFNIYEIIHQKRKKEGIN